MPDARGSAGAQLWLVVGDAPLGRFDEASISRTIANLDQVSRAAVAHEAVVESFISANAVLPMKLFTIFTSDARAVQHVSTDRARLDRVLRRVMKHDEWGVRVAVARVQARGASTTSSRGPTGASFLAKKKAQRDQKAEFAERSREVVAGLYDRLAGHAGQATRRAATDIPLANGPLLLDAAFLVPRSRTVRFQATVASQARRLHDEGYRVSLSGPWPPYSFLQDA